MAVRYEYMIYTYFTFYLFKKIIMSSCNHKIIESVFVVQLDLYPIVF